MSEKDPASIVPDRARATPGSTDGTAGTLQPRSHAVHICLRVEPVEGHPEIALPHRGKDSLPVPGLQQTIQWLRPAAAMVEGQDGAQPSLLQQCTQPSNV